MTSEEEKNLRLMIHSIAIREHISASANATLRGVIRSILNEKSLGTELAAKEEAAKQAYEAAEALLSAWKLVQQQREELASTPAGRRRGVEKPKFPEGTGANSLGALEKDLEKTQALYAKYNPEIADYEYDTFLKRLQTTSRMSQLRRKRVQRQF